MLLLFAALWLAALVRLPVLEDEAYYWTWSRALSLHYYDHPPLIAGLIRAAQAATGNATIALRLVSAACAFITVVFTLATSRCLASAATASITGGRAPISSKAPAAVSAGAWAMAASLSMSVVLLPATPDAPLSAALAVAAYATTRAMSPGSERWAVVAAVMFGIAIFAKLPAALAAA
ncbi:MAG: glycosyltransferase family 39 protein, partial [Myxococcota bacterium]